MKKVSILSLHLGYGGIEKSISSLANILIQKYEVEIICTYKVLEEAAFYIDPRVKITYLIEHGPNREGFKKYLHKHRYLSAFNEGMKGYKLLRLRKKTMIQAIMNSDSDIIISTRDIFNEWLSLYGKENVLKIGWEHNHYHDDMKYADKIVRSCSGLDYLVLVSNSLNAFYKGRLRNSKCKTVFIPNVIEYIPKDEQISSLQEKRIISIGRLSPEKGFMDLVKIFNIISNDYPDWHLDIIGDGVEKEKLIKYIKDSKIEEKVTLHGFRDKEYIYEMLTNSSIYLMTSYTESFGIVLLEAMSCGLPCIAFASAEGANEIITSGRDGYLIKNRNFSAYIQKVEDLINEEKIRKKIGHEGRRTVKKYAPDMVGKEWFRLLEEKW